MEELLNLGYKVTVWMNFTHGRLISPAVEGRLPMKYVLVLASPRA